MDVSEVLAHCLAEPSAIPDDELLEAIDESDRLVVTKLHRKHRPAGWTSA